VRQITVETRFYPFVLMSFRGDPTESEYRALFDSLAQVSRKALRESTKHVCITVSSSTISPQARKLVASLTEKFPEELMGPVIGSCVVVDSTLLRGLLTALSWLSPRLAKLDTAASPDEAMNTALACLRTHRVDVLNAEVMGARNWLKTEAARPQKSRSLRV
jgi:hypothetical protein